MRYRNIVWRRLWIAVLAAAVGAGLSAASAGDQTGQKTLSDEILRSARVAGGLCVHLGCGDGTLTVQLSGNGRFLVHGLDRKPALVETARRFIRSRGVYGTVWVERHSGTRLPYAENLANLVVVDDLPDSIIALEEIMRVVCPNGVAYVGQSARAARGKSKLSADALKSKLARAGIRTPEIIRRRGTWARIWKPRPRGMDEWGHARHGPDGNAASRDTLAGPPRRVRWIAGPMHEASNMITAGGRLFHAGIIARDAFNGLRLWERELEPTPMRLGYPARAMPGSVLPVAAGSRVFVVTHKKLLALNAATGQSVRAYPEAGTPREILHDNGILIAIDANSVKALNADGGGLLWSYPTADPGCVVTGDGGVFLLKGNVRRGEKRTVVRLDLSTGQALWRQSDYPWAAKVRRCSHHEGLLVCEVSTFNNDRPGNGIRVLSASDGKLLWERSYEPGMSHYMQARAVHTGHLVWILHKGVWEGLEARSGTVRKKWSARAAHCYPPVATPRFLLAGEMGFTDLATGHIDANRITKAACSRDAGFIPANGLLYCAPKHCACYPMLQGYVAMAPGRAGSTNGLRLALERGPAMGTVAPAAGRAAPDEWPCYRADPWRSGGTLSAVPAELAVLWTAEIGTWPEGHLVEDWKENPSVRGPVSCPVVADGLAFVAQPDAHRVVALDAQTGKRRWDFTANGRVDSPPTISGGLCLFGTRSGWVYCLRAKDGELVWRLRAAPDEDRIVAFGQLESPWPVPGSVLIVDHTAYFAAGRQSLADGGIFVFAVDPRNGKVRWVKRIASLPMSDFYGGAGLEFDPFDLLVAEDKRPEPSRKPAATPTDGPDFVTMSRWRIDRKTGEVKVVWKSGFGYYRTGRSGVMAPRGVWTYGPRMDYIPSGPKPGKPDYVHSNRRPLMVFRENLLLGSSDDKRRLFRRDFSQKQAVEFDDVWFNQRHVPRGKDQKGDRNRSQRLARGAEWTVNVFDSPEGGQGIGAMVLAGDTVFVAGKKGRLFAFSTADGKKLAERDLPAPVWDGVAAAYGKLYVSTRDGDLVCLGGR